MQTAASCRTVELHSVLLTEASYPNRIQRSGVSNRFCFDERGDDLKIRFSWWWTSASLRWLFELYDMKTDERDANIVDDAHPAVARPGDRIMIRFDSWAALTYAPDQNSRDEGRCFNAASKNHLN